MQCSGLMSQKPALFSALRKALRPLSKEVAFARSFVRSFVRSGASFLRACKENPSMMGMHGGFFGVIGRPTHSEVRGWMDGWMD